MLPLRTTLLLPLLLPALATQEDPKPSDPRDAPEARVQGGTAGNPTEELRALLGNLPPRTRLDAVRSVRVQSTVTFEGAPDRPHELTVAFAFPGRTRFELSNGAGGRRERYQLGAAVFAREVRPSRGPEEHASYPLRHGRLTEVSLDLAARRALFCWPDGREWTPGPKGSGLVVADVPGSGRLEAKVPGDPDGAPAWVRALRLDGTTASRLTVSAWRDVEGRAWPAKVRLLDGEDQLVWTEEITDVEPRWFLGDLWFVPADRTAALAGKVGADRMRLRNHGAVWTLRIPVEGDVPEGQARVRAEEFALERWRALNQQLAEAAEEGPWRLARVACLVLDGQGAPTAVEFECLATEGTKRPPLPRAKAPEEAKGKGVPEAWSLRGPRLVWHDVAPTPLGKGQGPSTEDVARLQDAARRSARANGTAPGDEIVVRLTLLAPQGSDAPVRVTNRRATAPLAPGGGPGGGPSGGPAEEPVQRGR